MHVAIIGAAGFLGRKLTTALLARGQLRGAALSQLTLADVVAPDTPNGATIPVQCETTDIATPEDIARAIPSGVDVVFHLAAIVSGQAEAEFDTGLRVNLAGPLNIFQRCRALGTTPMVVYASSVAVYGGDMPTPIEDLTILNPQTSYGAQKAIGELLLTDFSRKGFLDGRGLRLPTVTIRPGKPNKAASSFMSSIFREPLQGQPANCPVSPDYPVWLSAPRNTVHNLLHAAELEAAELGTDRCLGLPGMTATIGEMVEAMRRVAGDEPVSRITWERDPELERIVLGWKAHFSPNRARRLGFVEDRNFEDNVRWFLEDDIER
ncbi:MAG: SDR family oxidoreductase [Rhodobacteraceae bacterium]|nr:SDR family oxidoreductase [Paracoccaceae bacterium]